MPINALTDTAFLSLVGLAARCCDPPSADRPPAALGSVLFFAKGKLVNPITVPPGSTVAARFLPTDDAGNPAHVADPVVWSGSGLDGATVVADDPAGLTATVKVPAAGAGTFSVSAVAGSITAHGDVVVAAAENPATQATIDFTLVPPPGAPPS